MLKLNTMDNNNVSQSNVKVNVMPVVKEENKDVNLERNKNMLCYIGAINNCVVNIYNMNEK